MNVRTIMATTSQITTRTHFLSPRATLNFPALVRGWRDCPCIP